MKEKEERGDGGKNHLCYGVVDVCSVEKVGKRGVGGWGGHGGVFDEVGFLSVKCLIRCCN